MEWYRCRHQSFSGARFDNWEYGRFLQWNIHSEVPSCCCLREKFKAPHSYVYVIWLSFNSLSAISGIQMVKIYTEAHELLFSCSHPVVLILCWRIYIDCYLYALRKKKEKKLHGSQGYVLSLSYAYHYLQLYYSLAHVWSLPTCQWSPSTWRWVRCIISSIWVARRKNSVGGRSWNLFVISASEMLLS